MTEPGTTPVAAPRTGSPARVLRRCRLPEAVALGWNVIGIAAAPAIRAGSVVLGDLAGTGGSVPERLARLEREVFQHTA